MSTSISPGSISPPRGRSSNSSPSSSTAPKRLLHEIQEYANAPNEALLHLGPISDEHLLHWEAVLKGVRGSPYEGGLWLLNITIPPRYPYEPPKIEFATPICHPNIHFQTGEICLTLLTTKHWSPQYRLSSTLSAVQQLLTDPSPDSPLNVDIANLYREDDQIAAEGLVRYWTGEKRWSGEGRGGWISEAVPRQSGKLVA